MALENYCKTCGHRIFPNESHCSKCGYKTGNIASSENNVLVLPIHDIGFFNLDIDFSPYIESNRDDFKYEICSCGYLNSVDNEFCYMCGAKRSKSKLARIFKNRSKPSLFMDNILCECGAVNSRENDYCEMCGKKLQEVTVSNANYSNFNLEFDDSVFCFCGEENEKDSQFCRNCGLPLKNYGSSRDVFILCTCSTINEATSDFCIECGTSLNRENSIIVCICGEKNPEGSKFCQNCDKPLNPQKTLKTRIICSCGEILNWNEDYCHNCGKNIKITLIRKNSINNTVKSLKDIFR
ncbi:zinc ribbon domain-containing protein [uncultured Methanobrevibacter sp.]|uniref:zinc ribbon domain-containing protein n=1 Tax=uncultured Methanobrevibacter sp. TaxID=253161 RepID=UPI0026396C45|nr:zinc ribbon domain-containing protein [uncultured Methanobrevibacter sp.]